MRTKAGAVAAPDVPGRGIALPARGPAVLHAALVGSAIAAWIVSLPATDVRGMTDYGLLSTLPAGYYVALALLTTSFCIAVRSPRHWGLLALHVVLLLVMLHATPAILYGTLRYPWAWKHVGIIDYIQRHGSVNQNIGELTAYQDWPAFFALGALIVQAGGFGSALAFASWAPLFNNLLFAAATMFIFRSLTRDRRLAWLAVWVFCVSSWVGQDYFSPQATNYFLYLIVLGVCLRWLGSREIPAAESVQRWVRSGRRAVQLRRLMVAGQPEGRVRDLAPQAPALVAIIITITAVIVSGHQLTPFMLILSLSALVVFQVCAARGLPLLVGLMTAAWIIYMSVGFLKGNLYWIVQSIGSLNIGGSTLSNLASASHDHAVVAQVTRLLTVLVGALAVAGVVRRVRHGHLDLAAVLLAAVPVLMVWGNAYGGEMLFRVYFFALPFLAFLIAGLVFPSPRSGRTWMSALLALALCAALLPLTLISYYGSERMYRFSHDEVRSAQYLAAHAPPGSTLVGLTTAYPWGYRNYEYYSYVQLGTLPPNEQLRVLRSPVQQIVDQMGSGGNGHEYVVFSRAQDAEVEMTGALPPGSPRALEDAIRASSRFREVYRGPDAQVFELVGQGGRA